MTTDDTLVTDPTLLPVLEAAAEARRESLAILDLLDSYHANEARQESDEAEEQLALSKQQKLLNAYLAQLRRLNRTAILGVRSTKQETAERRQEIDSLHLQLQNLYYEQRHLRGEIAACEGYDHKYTQLPMTTVEEFKAQHPEHADDSDHDLAIARIADEQAARQALEEQRQMLLKSKEELVKETTAKKAELAKLDAEVEKWIAAESGVRAIFTARDNRLAET